MADIVELLEQTNIQLKRAEILHKEEKLKGTNHLIRQIEAEIKFLRKVADGKIPPHDSHLSCSGLINFTVRLDTIFDIGVKNVDQIGKSLKIESQRHRSNFSLSIDLVTNCGHCWIKVNARKPLALLRDLRGAGKYGEKNIVELAKTYLHAAKNNKVDHLIPYIVFCFPRGVLLPVREALIDSGFIVIGKIIEEDAELFDEPDDDDSQSSNSVFGDSEQEDEPESCSHDASQVSHLSSQCTSMKELVAKIDEIRCKPATVGKHLLTSTYPCIQEAHLDVSAMIAFCSNLSNNTDLCKHQSDILDQIAHQEHLNPSLPLINKIIEGKTLIVCQTAFDEFRKIVDVIGGPNEKRRAEELFKRVSVVKDSSSPRCLSLPVSSSMTKRSLIIFGTADYHKALIVTSNKQFVRASNRNGVCLTVFIHNACALSERKEIH